MHEAIVPQSACEMLADRDWLIPKSGGRPWLEKPPLPQWITVAVATMVGKCDQEWIVRLPPALIGTGVVVLLAWMGSLWFGQQIGLLAGFLLATMIEFTSYAWLAEADMYLCGIVTVAIAVFVHQEFGNKQKPDDNLSNFLGTRPWPIVAFFMFLGLSNLAKGPLFGTSLAALPIIVFLLWNRHFPQISRYGWFWGWVLFVLIAAAWPLAVWYRFPDVLDLWSFDYVGRVAKGYLGEPIWYYPLVWTWLIAPWTIVAAVGLRLTWNKALKTPFSAERFLWCWAFVPILALSVPNGKHHHYLLSSLAPWAIFGALGLRWCYDYLCRRQALVSKLSLISVFSGIISGGMAWIIGFRIAGLHWVLPMVFIGLGLAIALVFWALARDNPRGALTIIFLGNFAFYCFGHTYLFPITDQTLQDTKFLKQVPAMVTSEKPLMINADLGSMDLFRILFYLHSSNEQVSPIHNLTFLRDEQIHAPIVFVITRFRDKQKLNKLGFPTVLLKSEKSRRERSPDDQLTLFELKFHDNLVRGPAPAYISPMQAMNRQSGPFIENQL